MMKLVGVASQGLRYLAVPMNWRVLFVGVLRIRGLYEDTGFWKERVIKTNSPIVPSHVVVGTCVT